MRPRSPHAPQGLIVADHDVAFPVFVEIARCHKPSTLSTKPDIGLHGCQSGVHLFLN